MNGQQQDTRRRQPSSNVLKSHTSGHDHHAPATAEELSTRIVRIGLLTNLGLAGIKLAGGWVFKSKSLTADGWHSMTDLVTDILALAAIVVSSMLKSTDMRKSTIGHVESVMSLLASGLLVILGVHMGWESGVALRSQLFSQSTTADNVTLPHDHDAPSMQAMWVATLTILVKEWLYHASKCTTSVVSF